MVFSLCSRGRSEASFADYMIHRADSDTVRLLKAAPSPLVSLATRRKEPDFAWAPKGQTTVNGVPTVVLEVGVFNETEEELLEVAREWLDMPTTQVCCKNFTFDWNIYERLAWPAAHPGLGPIQGIRVHLMVIWLRSGSSSSLHSVVTHVAVVLLPL